MQYSYCPLAGQSTLDLDVKEYNHIFKVRRVAVGQNLVWCNLKDDTFYTYKIQSISKKQAHLELISSFKEEKNNSFKLHVGWSIVDPKTIEKNLAMLNELGVQKISFVYADFSQKNYKIDEKRLQRILINSSEQCGRTSLMQFEIISSVKEYLQTYPKSAIIDFSANELPNDSAIAEFLVGPEGGFSEDERELFAKKSVFGLKSSHILKSETALIGICAKLSI